MRSVLTTLFLILSLSAFSVAQSISTPTGTFRNTTPEDFLAENMPSKYYNELFTYHIRLQNGVQLIYIFSINDFGSFKDRVTGARVAVSWKDGNTYVINKEYPAELFINKAQNNYIQLHPERTYWAKGSFNEEHVLNFKTEKGGVSYDLTLTLYDIAQGKILGDGEYEIGDNKLGISFLIPHAKVKGHVAINGDTLQAKGTAFMDHMYQDNLSTKLIRNSYRVKTGDAQNGIVFNLVKLKEGNQNINIGYGIKYHNGFASLITPSNITSLKSERLRNVNLDTKIKFDFFQTNPITVEIEKQLNSYSILDELSGFKKFLARRYVGGEVIEVNGTATIDGNTPAYIYYMIVDD